MSSWNLALGPLEARLPWVAPTPPSLPRLLAPSPNGALCAPRPTGPSRGLGLPAPVPLAAVPPPLVRSASHPTSRAWRFALPKAKIATVPNPLAPVAVARLQLLAEPPSQGLRLGPLSQSVLPVLGGVPAIWGQVRQARAALSWGSVLRQRARDVAAAAHDLGQGLELGVTRGLGPDPRLRILQQRLTREGDALVAAVRDARFQLISVLLELGAVVTTLVPQVHGALGAQMGAHLACAMQVAMPWFLLGHGILGMAQASMGIWQARGGPPKDPDLTAARGHHRLQLQLWAGFCVSLALALYPSAWLSLAPWLPSLVLAGSIVGLAALHLVAADRYHAPRLLFETGPWADRLFDGRGQRAALKQHITSQDIRLGAALQALTAPLQPLRRALLLWLFEHSTTGIGRFLFVCCARAWLPSGSAAAWISVHQELSAQRAWARATWEAQRDALSQALDALDAYDQALASAGVTTAAGSLQVRQLGHQQMAQLNHALLSDAVLPPTNFGLGRVAWDGPKAFIMQKAQGQDMLHALAWMHVRENKP